ncbi:MAG: anaerobic ribonucleoside triphosphate reductase [Crenarchaeota archaeon]|nr:anaerobic ribonucleoside triphosphate reductase [Thermoproteota archaeon]
MLPLTRIREATTAIVEEYMVGKSGSVKENANKYPGPTGLLSYVAERALESLVYTELPERVAKLHLDGVIYVHKLPYSLFIPYCAGHSIRRLLVKGLKTPMITARPARHYDTFVDHVANYLITMQHYFSGAQAFGAVELYAGPFIRRDGLGYRAVKQGAQRLIYNLNFPSRVGMQTPFTNFTVILDAAKRMIEGDTAIYAGKDTGEPLADYLEEAKMFVRAMAEIHAEGDAAGRPFTFPILTYMTTSKILYEDPEVFEAVFGAAARKGTGYWLNTRVVNPDAAFSMCCRLVILKEELKEAAKTGTPMRLRLARRAVEEAREERLRALERQRMGGLWAMPDITGSKAVITLNLPRIVLESGRDDAAFEEKLLEVLEVVREGLLWFTYRYARQAAENPGFYMMPLEYVPEVFQVTGTPYFLTVGVLGLPEAAALMTGDPQAWYSSRKTRLEMAAWMRRIVEMVVVETRRWSRETGIPFNVEEVPGESAAAKLASRDAKRYPEVLEYLPDKEYPIYSTSIAPYYAPLELWERVEIEETVQPVFTGGVIMHIFLGEQPDPEALASLTRKLTANTRLIYWSYTPAITVCPNCGYNTVGIIETCPKCGHETEIWSRIIGYYRPLKRWHPARAREFHYRYHYTI